MEYKEKHQIDMLQHCEIIFMIDKQTIQIISGLQKIKIVKVMNLFLAILHNKSEPQLIPIYLNKLGKYETYKIILFP